MARSITDQEDLFTCFLSPILNQAHLETTLHILSLISSTSCIYSLDVVFDRLDIFSESLDCKSLIVGEVSIANEGHPHLDALFSCLS